MRRNSDRIQRNEERKEALVDSLRLPKDICMGAIKVTITGNREA